MSAGGENRRRAAVATSPTDGDVFAREVFHTSRLADFASQKELAAQTGHAVSEWPSVVLKEGIDNALDAAEDAGIAPVISVEINTQTATFIITDNGPGIPAEVVDGLCNYSIRVSSREAYVSPSRGRQGNALQTLLAMAFALDGQRGESLIEAHGIAHHVDFTIDRVKLEPRVTVQRSASLVRNGTRLTLRWPGTAYALSSRGPALVFYRLRSASAGGTRTSACASRSTGWCCWITKRPTRAGANGAEATRCRSVGSMIELLFAFSPGWLAGIASYAAEAVRCGM